MTNNTQIGNIMSCCQKGMILPPTMDPSKSKPAFQIQVYKMPLNLNQFELVPSQALLVPYANRTALATAWANLQHRTVPSPLPCADNCKISINWHLLTDFRGGWSSQLTLFNWDDAAFADWSVAVQMDNSTPGFEKAYSFNQSQVKREEQHNTDAGFTGTKLSGGESRWN
ncbi:Glycosyl-phosphatidyl inositol-anchored, plant [Cynara cardunculus var. scolymus]|uniref:Glycosyl-phosphatidyl inositol-anchored, plant n=1 Tax=Cynara cardunculus var. scolymus TaxID=59895 RepID=A0A103XT75_CYNCS|nr:Glycosyl-phosphatidyl inositol-anchored, plant [Cynara cardunculus var. scolymus]